MKPERVSFWDNNIWMKKAQTAHLVHYERVRQTYHFPSSKELQTLVSTGTKSISTTKESTNLTVQHLKAQGNHQRLVQLSTNADGKL